MTNYKGRTELEHRTNNLQQKVRKFQLEKYELLIAGA